MVKKLCVFAVSGVLLGAAPTAHAQMLQWDDRGFVGINLGLQPQTRTFTETASPAVYGELASVSVTHTIDSGPFFDVSAGVHVWENFGLGVGYSRFTSNETAPFTARVPNPLVFGSPRITSGTTGNLSHTENVFHVHALYMMPFSKELRVAALLGASFFNVSQDLVSGLTPLEGSPPFTTVAISSVETQSQSKTEPAITFGADVMYFFTKRTGAGGFVRYSRISGANVDIASPTGSGAVSVEAGGIQAGIGIRFAF